MTPSWWSRTSSHLRKEMSRVYNTFWHFNLYSGLRQG
jgi:hypothetical protein